MRPHLTCAIVLLAITASTRAPNEQQTGAPYEAVRFARDVMVSMRDGTTLAIDVYRPGRGGVPISDPLPVLLQRTPYNKDSLAAIASYFAQHGYVVVIEDMRGRYKSGGSFGKYDDSSATDGYDTIEWLANFPIRTARSACGARPTEPTRRQTPPS